MVACHLNLKRQYSYNLNANKVGGCPSLRAYSYTLAKARLRFTVNFSLEPTTNFT